MLHLSNRVFNTPLLCLSLFLSTVTIAAASPASITAQRHLSTQDSILNRQLEQERQRQQQFIQDWNESQQYFRDQQQERLLKLREQKWDLRQQQWQQQQQQQRELRQQQWQQWQQEQQELRQQQLRQY